MQFGKGLLVQVRKIFCYLGSEFPILYCILSLCFFRDRTRREETADPWIFTIKSKPAVPKNNKKTSEHNKSVPPKVEELGMPPEAPQSASLTRILLPILSQVCKLPLSPIQTEVLKSNTD